jgi:hypothetical protein
MKIVTLPVLKGKYEIISGLYIDRPWPDDRFLPQNLHGYVLEPYGDHPFAANKIPPGVYQLDLVLSNEFSHKQQYLNIFSEIIDGDTVHRMIRIKRSDNPNCQHEYLHIGNFAIINYAKVPDIFKSPNPADYTNTLGCNLCGNSWTKMGSNGGPAVSESEACYERLYPVIRAAILGEGATWEVMD